MRYHYLKDKSNTPHMERVESLPQYYLPNKYDNDGSSASIAGFTPVQTRVQLDACFGGHWTDSKVAVVCHHLAMQISINKAKCFTANACLSTQPLSVQKLHCAAR